MGEAGGDCKNIMYNIKKKKKKMMMMMMTMALKS